MRFPYSIKGCSHCANKSECPLELKRSDSNLIPFREGPRIVEGSWGRKKESFCRDYVMEGE